MQMALKAGMATNGTRAILRVHVGGGEGIVRRGGEDN